jgi:hypothetical protein
MKFVLAPIIALAAVISLPQIELPEGEIIIRVLDESGKLVSSAEVGASFTQPYGVNQGYKAEHKSAITGSDGFVTFKGKTAGEVSYSARKEGYYVTYGQPINFRQRQVEGKSMKVKADLILRKVINPVPMYARNIEIVIPAPNTEFAFDLQEGDWVAPVGKGETPDFRVRVTGYYRDATDYDSSLTITFSNKGDGFIPFQAHPRYGSALRLPHQAPEDGYKPEWTWRKVRKHGQTSSEWINPSREDQNYFYRVRTILDEQGRVIKTLYGKIYSDIEFGGASEKGSYLKMTYYLNPDGTRNTEFNPKQNLFKGLASYNEPRDP